MQGHHSEYHIIAYEPETIDNHFVLSRISLGYLRTRRLYPFRGSISQLVSARKYACVGLAPLGTAPKRRRKPPDAPASGAPAAGVPASGAAEEALEL